MLPEAVVASPEAVATSPEAAEALQEALHLAMGLVVAWAAGS